MQGQLSASLLSTWWERQAVAGASEPNFSSTDVVAKPRLTILTWRSEMPMVPAAVQTRFDDTSDVYGPFQAILANVQGQLSESENRSRPAA